MSSVRYVRIEPTGAEQPSEFPDLVGFAPFKTIIIIDEPCTDEFRNAAARWLVDSGCLYAMAWGHDCTLWDDAIDYANLEDFDYGDVPDDRFIMTTWHVDEPLREVFWFAAYAAKHDTAELENILILHLCTDDREKEFRLLLEEVRNGPA